MMTIAVLAAVVAGFALGLASAYVLRVMHGRTTREILDKLFRENEAQRKAQMEELLNISKTLFDSERTVSTRELEGKKGLIDQQLQRMTSELTRVSDLMNRLEKDREGKFGELASQLRTTNEQTLMLTQTVHTLREALASTKKRGQWGERMAEDILRLAGFIENVNYVKQKAIEGAGSRPDFTFLLPRNLTLNMDVKFPLDNYLKFLEARSDQEREKCRTDFLKDVKSRIREVTTREYINPEQNTVDSVLLFIPNEQIYAFIHEQDSSILEDGIRNKVVFCSPITFFVVLAVIRQAIDSFSLERTSNEILSLFGAFKKQWKEFVDKMELVGNRIRQAHDEYEALSTTRRRQLERPLEKIENLRTQRGLPVAPDEDAGSVPAVEDPAGREARRV